jgi:hypothetical protein
MRSDPQRAASAARERPPGARGARPAAPLRETATAVLADAHVHFHACFPRDLFFASALANFRAGARELGLPEATPGLLLLAERREERWFDRWREEAALAEQVEPRPRGWSFAACGERDALEARCGRDRLFLLAGRQIEVREGLEVLALATGDELPDNFSLGDTLEWARERGTVTVLPWGFGKWWGERGRILAELLRRAAPELLFLGDSAGRPAAAPDPAPFRAARSRRLHVLPGTDPLPLPRHAVRPGSYGFLCQGPFDPARPAESLRRLLRARRGQPRAFGRRTGLAGFALDQAALRLRRGAGPGAVPRNLR